MATVALVSGKGSPGASTAALALALVWPLRVNAEEDAARRVLVVEADAAGSAARPGYLRGRADPDSGMPALLDAGPKAVASMMRRCVVRLEEQEDRFLLPGLAEPQHMAAHRQDWTALARWLVSQRTALNRTDVLLDVGRVASFAEPAALLAAADLLLVVCQTDLPSAMGAVHAITYLQAKYPRQRAKVGCLLVGERRPYSRLEVEASLEVPVVAVLAWDPSSSAVLSHGRQAGRSFSRGRLLRSAVPIADELAARAAEISHRRMPEVTAHG